MDIINKDIKELSEEEKSRADEFNERLKDKIIDDLVDYESEELIKKLNSDKEFFIDSIYNILVNGSKGLKNLNVKQLIEIYLNKKTQEEFIKLVEDAEKNEI